ncbi:MAG: ribonuclease domain-containing protein [Pseudomonadota bacterium]|nr:ribonuclease domain-containing protein [Pseudomonadota bacterium]
MLRTAASHAARSLLAVSLWVVATSFADVAHARGPSWGFTDDATIAVTDMPRQGQRTYALILRGGPFPYEKDGTVFGNRERLLPRERRGYYREYTVVTPGARDRGARRIVCGGQRPVQPDACYYTSDHYSSFRKIVP